MTSPVAVVPPSLSSTFSPRIRPDWTERSPTYGALTPFTSRLNWTIGMPESTISLRPTVIDSPGTDVAMPWAPAATRLWTAFSCASASPPSGPVTCRSTLRSLAAALAPSMICWMNGLPMTWVTNPSLIFVALGSVLAEAEAEAGADEAGACVAAADWDAVVGAVVAAPPLQAPTTMANTAGNASQERRFTG